MVATRHVAIAIAFDLFRPLSIAIPRPPDHFPMPWGHCPRPPGYFSRTPGHLPRCLGYFTRLIGHCPRARGHSPGPMGNRPGSYGHFLKPSGHRPGALGHFSGARVHGPGSGKSSTKRSGIGPLAIAISHRVRYRKGSDKDRTRQRWRRSASQPFRHSPPNPVSGFEIWRWRSFCPEGPSRWL
uniref:Uncharacterized protein n=1 Tax=Candidatus Kentrum eta TaxID=2126337 RepID=A0A450UJY5_9GAMM|nr:MAG: hypothetical protein BECKH772A_GA0070896_100495 [Candidatus Kentron sp. H]VFJ93664.1 MAG: hypothetical protein BECKH772B_GA0070898_100485 [Candidatus Kentron sp. H]VFK00618.1 MAG: hypothetical protein BECKH772C_GA0070978_100495 [Candidatus Kentron sp. H]